MKASLLSLLVLFLIGVRGAASDQNNNLIRWVDPFIATKGDHGQLYPGATTPFGLVKLSPETTSGHPKAPKGHSGYSYEHPYIYGFSHLRLDGSGVTGAGGNILLQPGMGTLETNKETFKQKYRKDSEKASAGYYTVTYESGLKTELSATPRVGFHQYTFPVANDAHVVLDLGHSHCGMLNAELEIVSPNKVKGMITSKQACHRLGGNQHFTLYFTIVFDQPFDESITWNQSDSSANVLSRKGIAIGAGLRFKALQDKVLRAKVGISPLSRDEAEKEIDTECPQWDLQQVVADAERRWEEKLQKIQIKTDRDDWRKLFYTLLYRTYTSPQIVNASSGKYRPALQEETIKDVTDVRKDFTYYCGWDIWGNYRNKFGLVALTEPTVLRDTALAILEYYRYRENIVGRKYTFRAEGYWPAPTVRQEFAGIYILEAIEKGILNLTEKERQIAYEGMRQDYEAYPYEDSRYGLGYVMEKAHHAWMVMKMAEIMKMPSEVQKYKRHALGYQKHWNPDQPDQANVKRGFFTYHAKTVRGKDTLSFKHAYEGCLWHYKWNVPFDVQGLVNLRGSREELAGDLQHFFEQNYYMALNQTDIQLPYLFNYLGKPWLTQKYARKYTTKEAVHVFHNHGFFKEPVVRPTYIAQPDGFLPTMDDDLGQNSSWFVQGAIGLFPAIPGEEYYFIGSPIFPEIKIGPKDGNAFTIIANNVSEQNFYIKKATLNGAPLNRVWIAHTEIARGGTLELEMDSVPNKEWGANEFLPSLSAAEQD